MILIMGLLWFWLLSGEWKEVKYSFKYCLNWIESQIQITSDTRAPTAPMSFIFSEIVKSNYRTSLIFIMLPQKHRQKLSKVFIPQLNLRLQKLNLHLLLPASRLLLCKNREISPRGVDCCQARADCWTSRMENRQPGADCCCGEIDWLGCGGYWRLPPQLCNLGHGTYTILSVLNHPDVCLKLQCREVLPSRKLSALILPPLVFQTMVLSGQHYNPSLREATIASRTNKQVLIIPHSLWTTQLGQ